MNTIGTVQNGKYIGTPSTPVQKARFAEMLQTRQAPRCMTDAVFFEGQGTLASQFGSDTRSLEQVTQAAIRQGYTPNPNDVYNAQLARSVGDPLAFIPASGGRGYVADVLRKQGRSSVDGAVIVHSETKAPKRKRLGDDLVREGMQEMIAANPDLARIDKRDLASEVISRHGAKK